MRFPGVSHYICKTQTTTSPFLKLYQVQFTHKKTHHYWYNHKEIAILYIRCVYSEHGYLNRAFLACNKGNRRRPYAGYCFTKHLIFLKVIHGEKME